VLFERALKSALFYGVSLMVINALSELSRTIEQKIVKALGLTACQYLNRPA
jgi:hypothetical protein